MSVIVPMNEIPKDSLKNLITGFVLREGTDYGEQEVDLEVKVEQVLGALNSGEAVVVYSELDESFDIVNKTSLNLMNTDSKDND